MAISDNIDLVTRTGPGTPFGEVVRRYWVPAFTSDDLPSADSPPIRVRLLGEQLVAFRASDGQVGLMEEFCAHRGASLYLGRTEGDGIRCAYHGWKYDHCGQCIEMPSEPAKSRFKERIRLRAYRTAERAGVVWAYMGEGTPPGLPEFEWMMVPEEFRFVSRRLQECNYLQTLEGGIDTSHASVLHSDRTLIWEPEPHDDASLLDFADSAPRFHVRPVGHGLQIAAERHRIDGRRYIRITQLIAPWYTILAPFEAELIGAHAFIPQDDHTCTVWSIDYRTSSPLTELERARFRRGEGIHAETIPGTIIPVLNRSNGYLVDRALQRVGSVTGIRGIAAQDAAVQESMGPIVDRSREHLGSSDAAIVMARRLLIKMATGGADAESLPGLDPSTHGVRSAGVYVDAGESWEEAAVSATVADPRFYGGRRCPVGDLAVSGA